ncbi:50S ribosomal protein L25/general stress protein Ctc [Mechercharimyces sp. CAU 1602]|uniref:50S ribosomal protein L25/general stress protein Ctc n=1 Tax=Mechercharimyces sp. CAU 1602 TaxID=2973933 RepID=UPI0021628598|nr:50S ribosomal protein L25/general stress protein Ctc [Mechercharimyces sp. CAU 1602]MCS1352378.1 50S ribosomal protein L25/general stress protein Ctc [Mechercharimyces sp. CAU 1602]
MTTKITAEKREGKPRSIITRLRRSGRVPGILYGVGTDNQLLHVDEGEMKRLLHNEGLSSVVSLQLGQQPFNVMIRELQRDHVKGHFVHVDFEAISMNEVLEVDVPLELTGTPIGEKENGVLEQPLRTISIRCLPSDIPDSLSVDVQALDVGDSLAVKDIAIQSGIEVLTDENEVVATVTTPQHNVAAEENDEDEGVAAATEEESEEQE